MTTSTAVEKNIMQPSVLKVSTTNGVYQPWIADELLSDVLDRHLQFHKLQNYRNEIRHEESCAQSKENMARVKGAVEEMKQLLDLAKARKCQVKVETVLRVTMIS